METDYKDHRTDFIFYSLWLIGSLLLFILRGFGADFFLMEGLFFLILQTLYLAILLHIFPAWIRIKHFAVCMLITFPLSMLVCLEHGFPLHAIFYFHVLFYAASLVISFSGSCGLVAWFCIWLLIPIFSNALLLSFNSHGMLNSASGLFRAEKGPNAFKYVFPGCLFLIALLLVMIQNIIQSKERTKGIGGL